jgi:hypothetical protein
MIKRWFRRRFARCRREDGTATVEFVFTVPIVILVLLGAFESGIYMIRYVMLDRAVDMTVRDLGVGLIPIADATPEGPTPVLDALKTSVCSELNIISDCRDVLKIELYPVDTATWSFPTNDIECVDREANVDVVLELPEDPYLGAENQPMLFIACITADALFPTTGLAASMQQDGKGGYFILASSAFVNEP